MMGEENVKKFNITVNDVAYEVEIEEVGGAPSAPRPAAPKAAPKAAPAAAPAPKAAPKAAPAVSAGDTPVNAPMPGKITKVVASVGQAVKKGETVVFLEAMKMQNEIAAPVDGTVKSMAVSAGQTVKPGENLFVIG